MNTHLLQNIIGNSTTTSTGIGISSSYITQTPNPNPNPNIVANQVTYSSAGWQNTYYAFEPPSELLVIRNYTNDVLVTLYPDGRVEWADNIEIDEAAAKFSAMLNISPDIIANIKYENKKKIRDSIFEDMIELAKDKNLTVEDLTCMWHTAKMMDKLRGL